ncbi:MAG: NAD(P)H-hydrate dehydratase [Clostridiales bacterium]|nr:NAD(P)H-hydrate dehydratase [Clostridiales bacterium]
MHKIYSAYGMKQAERHAFERGYGYYEMMLTAGKTVASALPVTQKDRVLVVCGGGNNGGDGYVIAQQLFQKKIPVKVYQAMPPKTKETLRAQTEYQGEYESTLATGEYTAIVECLMGTGFSGEPKGESKALLQKLNEMGKQIPLYAVDIPAGLNADTGEGKHAVKAVQTFAVEGFKFGHFLGDGLDMCGKLTVLPIEIGGEAQAFLADENLLKQAFPPLKRNMHKGTHGRATLIAGSKSYTGAARLAANATASLLTGAGYAELVSVPEVIALAKTSLPELIYTNAPSWGGKIRFRKKFYAEICARSRVIAVGAGLGVSKNVYRLVRFLLQNFKGTLLIDADGLNSLAKYGVETLKTATAKVVLTPHPAEFSRLSGKPVSEILSSPYESLILFAKEYGVTCLLKGASTLISDGSATYLSATGSPAMAKGGSGDVLLGVALGMFSRESELTLPSAKLLSAACYFTGRAGELATQKETEYTATPTDTVNCLKAVIKEIT